MRRPRGHLLQGHLGIKNHSAASQGPLAEPLGCPRATCEATAALPAMTRGPEEAPGGTAPRPLLGAPRGSPESPKSLTVQRFSLIYDGPRRPQKGTPEGPPGAARRAPGGPQGIPQEPASRAPGGPQGGSQKLPRGPAKDTPRASFWGGFEALQNSENAVPVTLLGGFCYYCPSS